MIDHQVLPVERAVDELPRHQDGRDGEDDPHPLGIIGPRAVLPHPKEYVEVFILMPGFEQGGQAGGQAGGVVPHQRFGIVRIEQFQRFDDEVETHQPAQTRVQDVGRLQRPLVVDGRLLGVFPVVHFSRDPPPVAEHPDDHGHPDEYFVRRPIVHGMSQQPQGPYNRQGAEHPTGVVPFLGPRQILQNPQIEMHIFGSSYAPYVWQGQRAGGWIEPTNTTI